LRAQYADYEAPLANGQLWQGFRAMGLFSSVVHLRDVERDRLKPAMDAILLDAGFASEAVVAVPTEGPYALSGHDGAGAEPCYVASPLVGRWLTLIETHFALSDAPHLSDLGKRLSSALSCYALTLFVHDDDLFMYNLDYKGVALDGYNSCPQYFEQQRLSETDVEQQRHAPEPFSALLPPGSTLDELRVLLNRGWWQAHDTGNLDAHGVSLDEDDGFIFEGERMTAFGTLLKLHGGAGTYPYAAWGNGEGIDWPSFRAIRYRRK
jgi:hypothetical protein